MRSSCSRIAGTAAAASGVLTVMRTSSEPAVASSLTCMAVPMASAVSVLVMDCTTTGASPPICTTRSPQRTAARRVGRLAAAPTVEGVTADAVKSLIIGNGLEPIEDQPGFGYPAPVHGIEGRNKQDRQDHKKPAPRTVGAFRSNRYLGITAHGRRHAGRGHHAARCGGSDLAVQQHEHGVDVGFKVACVIAHETPQRDARRQTIPILGFKSVDLSDGKFQPL